MAGHIMPPTPPTSDIRSRTEHLCQCRPACTQSPVGSPMEGSQLCEEEDGVCVQTQAPPAAAGHTLMMLVTIPWYLL